MGEIFKETGGRAGSSVQLWACMRIICRSNLQVTSALGISMPISFQGVVVVHHSNLKELSTESKSEMGTIHITYPAELACVALRRYLNSLAKPARALSPSHNHIVHKLNHNSPSSPRLGSWVGPVFRASISLSLRTVLAAHTGAPVAQRVPLGDSAHAARPDRLGGILAEEFH